MTAPVLRTDSVTAAVKGLAARCDGPTLATLTAAGDTVTARSETLPGGPHTADSIVATLAGMARMIARHPAMFTADVAGYAVILPGERVAFATDRTGERYRIPLSGVPTEPQRRPVGRHDRQRHRHDHRRYPLTEPHPARPAIRPGALALRPRNAGTAHNALCARVPFTPTNPTDTARKPPSGPHNAVKRDTGPIGGARDEAKRVSGTVAGKSLGNAG